METITIYVGSVVKLSSGKTQDSTREVQFEGERLAEHTEYGYSDRTGTLILTDTRGVTETLYRTGNGLLIVQVKNWAHWVGEPTIYNIVEIVEANLGVNGRFEALGRKAGFGQPLTLEEVLGKHPQPA